MTSSSSLACPRQAGTTSMYHIFTHHHHHYELHVRPSYYHTICQSTRFNGCAAVLLLHLLALLLATVVFVVVNDSVVCTTAVAMAVIVTVMYLLWSHASCSVAMTTTASSTIKRFFQFLLPEPHALLRVSLNLCQCEEGLDVIALWAGPHDGGQRFFTLALTRKSHGLSDYCKADVCTINVLVAVIVSSSCFSSDHHHYYDLDVRP